MKIEILGTGCPNCLKLKKDVELAILELNLKNVELKKVEEIDKIIAMGVISTPALVVDGEVKTSGRLPNLEEIKSYLNE